MRRTTRTLTGLGLVVGGALLGMLAMTALPWYRGTFGGILNGGTSAARIRASITLYENVPFFRDTISLGISPIYFRWLAIALVLAGALVALLTVGLDRRPGRVLAGVAIAIAVAGLVATAFAVQYVHVDAVKLAQERGSSSVTTPPGYGDFIAHTGLGAWAIVLGYLAIAAGAVLLIGGRDSMRELLATDDTDAADDTSGAEVVGADEPAEPVRVDKRADERARNPVEPDERPW